MRELDGAVVPEETRAQAPADKVLEDAPESWPVESTTEAFRNWLIGVRNDQVRMPGDRVAERSVVTHPGAVSVLALDDAGRALMIRQYRHPVGHLLWELPAGLLDHPSEPLVDAAKRELLEETGYRASTWHTLVDHYSSPGFTNERVRIFLARDLQPASEDDGEPGFVREHEEALIVTAWLPLPDAVSAILAGKLHSGHTIAGLLAGHVAASRGFAGLRPADAADLPGLTGLTGLAKDIQGAYLSQSFPWGTTGDRYAPTGADSGGASGIVTGLKCDGVAGEWVLHGGGATMSFTLNDRGDGTTPGDFGPVPVHLVISGDTATLEWKSQAVRQRLAVQPGDFCND